MIVAKACIGIAYPHYEENLQIHMRDIWIEFAKENRDMISCDLNSDDLNCDDFKLNINNNRTIKTRKLI